MKHYQYTKVQNQLKDAFVVMIFHQEIAVIMNL